MTTTVSGLTPYAQAAVPLTQRTAAAAAITASYTLVGSLFSKPVVTLMIVSTLDQAVQLSLDGTNDWCPVPAGSTMVVDLKSNLICLEGWRGVYVKEIGDPASGTLYITGFTL